jgi:hypothetical protein
LYAATREELEKIARPRNILDQLKVAHLAYHLLQIARLQKCANGLVKINRRSAIYQFIMPIVGGRCDLAEAYVNIYFKIEPHRSFPAAGGRDGVDKATVTELLRKHGLDDAAIDIKAFEISLPTLAMIGSLLLLTRLGVQPSSRNSTGVEQMPRR